MTLANAGVTSIDNDKFNAIVIENKRVEEELRDNIRKNSDFITEECNYSTILESDAFLIKVKECKQLP